MGQILAGLSPDAQFAFIVCSFALALVILMIVFLVIEDRRKMQALTDGTDKVTRSIARLRKSKSLEKSSDQLDK